MAQNDYHEHFIDVLDVVVIIAIGAFLIIAIFVFLIIHEESMPSYPQQQVLTAAVTNATTTPMIDPFAQVNLQAKAAYVWDVNTQEPLFEYNSTTTLPLASLTKLMMAVTAKSILPDTATVTVTPDALKEDGDNGLLPNEKWTFKNLMDFTLIVSSNDGAEALGTAAGGFQNTSASPEDQKAQFIQDMNSEAAQLNLPSMSFANMTGLDIATGTPGAVGSAQDVAKLMEYIIKNDPELLEVTTYPSMRLTSLSTAHIAQNTDTLAGQIPGLLGSKTGYTALAGGNLAVAFDVGLEHPVIVVVLGSTFDDRFTDMQKLVRIVFDHFSTSQ
jgi:serine-type D-Ala-D-Ala carboxypeptidase (penicillin-binding protein 5/6)